jgi:DNA-binding CsgD family transcriptional regulator
MTVVSLGVFLGALLSGFASILLSFFIYLKYRKLAILFYIFFLISLFFIILYFFFHLFGGIATADGVKRDEGFLDIIQFIGSLGFIAVAPYFYHFIIGLRLTRVKIIIWTGFDIAVLVCAVIYYITRIPEIGYYILAPSMALTIVYGLYIVLRNLHAVADKRLSTALKTFLWVGAGFFPLILLDMLDTRIFGITIFPSGFFALPLYYLVLNILSIIFTMVYFNRPAYLQNGRLTEFFTGEYGITSREGEIIVLLLDGGSNREIGEKLFISYKTVENHIYSIYQKTGVKNRIELFNLILSNR